MALWNKFFGTAAQQAAGFTIGFAAGPALAPAVQELINAAWYAHPDKPLRAIQLAAGVASGQLERVWAEGEARFDGVDSERFKNLIRVFDAGPGMASAFEMWRRELIDEAQFRRALKRESLEPEWIDALVRMRNVLLSPADLAMMRQQGFIDAARQHDESARQGVTNERADLLFEVSGLPPPTERGMEMLRRGIISEAEFRQIVREGHEKTKYTDEELALRRVLLNPSTIVALYLKGWITQADFHARMVVHGYDAGEADDWYDSAGRPAAPGQMATAAVRGIDGPDGRPMDREQFLKGIRESDIRPEWGPMLWDARFLYPSLFQLTRLVTSGTIDGDTGAAWAHKARYAPEVVTALRQSWDRPAATTSKGLSASDLANEYEARWLTRAQYVAGLKEIGYTQTTAEAKADAEDSRRARAARDKRIELIGQRYVKHGISRERAVTELTNAAVPARVRDGLLAEWDVMRGLTPDALTVSQIRKAYRNAQITRVDAVARLEAKNYDEADANLYLDE